MERLERVVVHVEEAIRLASIDQEPRKRLGLMLLDSAAELLLHRECEYRLGWEEWDRCMLASIRAGEASGHTLTPDIAKMRDELVAKITSDTQRKRITQNFDAKAEFLQRHGLLDSAQVRVLSKLHRYRNEAYHRDAVRPATLDSSVRIYIYLVCHLMMGLPIHSMGWGAPSDIPVGLQPYVELMDGFPGLDWQANIGRAFIEAAGVSTQEELGLALARHVEDRLAGLNEDLEFSAGFIGDLHPSQGWDEEAVLHLVQVEDGREPAFSTPGELRAKSVPVRMSQLDEWRLGGIDLAGETDSLAAFAAFADVEDAIEPIEEKVHELAVGIDHQIQLEIDEARGK